MRSILFASLAALACEPSSSARASQLATVGTKSAAIQQPVADTVRRGDTAIVRGLYVLRWAAQSPARMKKLIAMADSTEVNALVIDIKDEFGLNYKSSDTLVARNAGNAGTIPNLRAMVEAIDERIVADPPTMRRYAAQMRGAVGQLSLLVDDLFELVQVDAGAIEAESGGGRIALWLTAMTPTRMPSPWTPNLRRSRTWPRQPIRGASRSAAASRRTRARPTRATAGSTA